MAEASNEKSADKLVDFIELHADIEDLNDEGGSPANVKAATGAAVPVASQAEEPREQGMQAVEPREQGMQAEEPMEQGMQAEEPREQGMQHDTRYVGNEREAQQPSSWGAEQLGWPPIYDPTHMVRQCHRCWMWHYCPKVVRAQTWRSQRRGRPAANWGRRHQKNPYKGCGRI